MTVLVFQERNHLKNKNVLIITYADKYFSGYFCELRSALTVQCYRNLKRNFRTEIIRGRFMEKVTGDCALIGGKIIT